jgi:hypothetical protein
LHLLLRPGYSRSLLRRPPFDLLKNIENPQATLSTSPYDAPFLLAIPAGTALALIWAAGAASFWVASLFFSFCLT